MDKDGNEIDGDGSRPQKHAKSPELAREFLLDAATVIFKDQVSIRCHLFLSFKVFLTHFRSTLSCNYYNIDKQQKQVIGYAQKQIV